MDEHECITDALLVDVVQQAKAARLALRSVERNPEDAWLDGYVAGWFAGHFKRTHATEPITEPFALANPSEANR